MINKDPFSNGTECDMFMSHNCERCQKNSEYNEDTDTYSNADDGNYPLCPILKDIMLRMISDEPISEETISICDDFVFNGTQCPRLEPIEQPEEKKDDGNENYKEATLIFKKEEDCIDLYRDNCDDDNCLASTKNKVVGYFTSMLLGTLDEMKDRDEIIITVRKGGKK